MIHLIWRNKLAGLEGCTQSEKSLIRHSKLYYHPQTKFGVRKCLSVDPVTGGGAYTPLGRHPLSKPSPGRPPRQTSSSTEGSYWNAFLLRNLNFSGFNQDSHFYGVKPPKIRSNGPMGSIVSHPVSVIPVG